MKKLILTVLFIFLLPINSYALEISAECAYLLLANTGEVLYEKNGKKTHNIASTTKIMTALLAIEKDAINQITVVSENAASQEGSSIYLRRGEEVKINDLLYGMMLNSGNDAACAIAEHISGDVDTFAVAMTKRAKELGAHNTSFKNPNGLDAKGHYSTAQDLAIISAYALQNDKFCDIVSTKTAEIETSSGTTYLKNHNKMLWNYEGCIGIKTGYTKSTGRCLVSAARKDGALLIAVTLNAPNDWQDHTKMLDFGFSQIENKEVLTEGKILKNFTYNSQNFNAVAKEAVYSILKKGEKQDIDIFVHTIKSPTVSFKKGEKLGFAEIFVNEKLIKKVDLVSDNDFNFKVKNDKKQLSECINKVINFLLLKM